MHVEDLDTPAVTILLDRLEANIARGQALLNKANLKNRPHIKTHKIPAIAKMQLDAGAVGITCQKLGEVEVFIDSGVTDDILVSFNIVGLKKTDRLMALSERIRRLAVFADSEDVVRGLSEAGVRHGRDVPVLVECDTGGGRNGVQSPEAAQALARFAADQPRIRFEGLATYPSSEAANVFMARAKELLEKDGIAVPVISGGGTPALPNADKFTMMTEHRTGTYVFNDLMMIKAGYATLDDCAMHVRATVVSVPTPDRAIIDAGSKTLTREQVIVTDFGHIVEYPQARIVNLSEEHGIVDLSASAKKPKVGEVVSVVPNHTCVVTNMVDELYGVRNGEVEVVWPVAARGRSR